MDSRCPDGCARVGARRRRAGAEDPADGLHRAGDRPARRPTRTASARSIRTSRSSGCAIRPASITAKLLAEKANPQADVVWGVAASSLALLDRKGMLKPYAPLNLDAIMSQYRDKKSPPAWWGMDVFGAMVCFNTVEAKKKNMPKPETWKDLTKPDYKGQIVMPNPASSGTGYFDVVAWLHAVGRRQRQGRRLEVHGRAAREHRPVHALGLQALQHGGRRRIRGRHLVRIPRPHQQGQGRADRPGVPEGRPRLGPRSRSRSTRARRSSRRRRSWPTGPRARTR